MPSRSGSDKMLRVKGPIDIRVCGRDAAEDLARLWVRAQAFRRGVIVPAAPETEHVDGLAGRIGREGAAAVVATEQGVAVACCFFEPLLLDGEPVQGSAHLSGVAVEPQRWGEGLATAVVNAALTAARERGYRHVQLHVLEDNDRARRLYGHLGWTLSATGHEHPEGLQAVYDKDLHE